MPTSVLTLTTLAGLARRALAGATMALVVLAVLAAAPDAARAGVCTAPVTNKVACENTQQGTPQSVWGIEGSGDPSIQGFATSMSVNVGGSISFKIKSTTANYKVDIYRLGYYGGDGARLMAGNLEPSGTGAQPACNTFTDTGLVDCGNWGISLSWNVPTTAVSGVYIAHLKRDDGTGSSHITFVVRDESSHSDIVLQTSDATWQAYNTYGGNSLYNCTVACPPGAPLGYAAAYAVSYNRPVITEDVSQFFTGAEYPFVRWVEANGYDVSYLSNVDVAMRGQLLLNHKLFMDSGHDEYWSASQRNAMTAARDAGVNLAFFSGNEGFWKTRWLPSQDGTNTPHRTLVSYKDTHWRARQDPVEWTGTWRDPRWTLPSENVTPENALTGQSFEVNSGTSRITVPYAYKDLRLWRNTDVEDLAPGGTLQLAPQTLGVEWDVDADNGFRPPGTFRLSSTTVSGLEIFQDYGSTTQFGLTGTHNLTMYRASSGALVFGAGTMQWSFGLDSTNRTGNPADPNMQQATVNLFADMDSQPATLQPGLVAATKSSDTTAPVATITSPPATVTDGQTVTLSGTATDTGGGVVAGIEVSTDGGQNWHPATGTTSWTYSWKAHGAPSTTIKVRATDDSGNLQTPSAGVPVTVTCPCTMFGALTPAVADGGDPSPVEVGVKFTTDVYGTVSGVRFYKSALNTGTHIGSLWTSDGQRLAQATFQSESATGWQTVSFETPVTIEPGKTYVVSYYAPNGHYAATPNYFYRAPAPGPNGGAFSESSPLHPVRNSGTVGNGVYSYGATSVFPTSSYLAANYWVDVRFAPIPVPGQVTNVVAAAGSPTSANVKWSAPSTGGAVTTYTVTPYLDGVAQTARTVSGSLKATTITGLTTGSSYTFKVQAANLNGSGPVSAASNAVTPTVAVAPSAPYGVIARPAGNAVRVEWTAAENTGGSAITGQTVTPYEGTTALPAITVGAGATSTVVNGLTNGTAYTFRVAATNAIGTGEASDPSSAAVPQATLFDFSTPSNPTAGAGASVEVGVKFKADYDGFVTGVRFYKDVANVGVHIGSLWKANGDRMSSATFQNETASGWQTVTFPAPVAVTAGDTYVASYFSSNGSYSATGFAFGAAIDMPPLHALSNITSSNGVYSYGSTTTFPTSSFNAANYWVDVLFALPKPGTPTAVAATAGGQTSANVTWTPPTTGGPVESYIVTPYIGSTAQTPKTAGAKARSVMISGLTQGTGYTFKVQAKNANGLGTASASSNVVTPVVPVVPMAPSDVVGEPGTQSVYVTWERSANDGDSAITSQRVTPYVGGVAQTPVDVGPTVSATTITGLTNGTAYTFDVTSTNGVGTSERSDRSVAVTPNPTLFDFGSPATADVGNASPVELGVKFRADFAGSVTGIRFYKSPGNTGTHVGNLWSASGTSLARATFTEESDSGWQSVTFDSPIAITPDTTYVASYFAPNGHYSLGQSFTSGLVRSPLYTLANSVSPNGLYEYGASTRFPDKSHGASNYLVDVMFAPAPAPGAPTAVTATAKPGAATVSWTAPATGGPVTSYIVTPYIGTTAQTAKTVTGTPPATTTTVSGLTAGSTYTFKVQAANPTGTSASSTASAAVVPTSGLVPSAPLTATAQADDSSAIVTWAEPESDGGGPVTGYTITPYDGATALTPVQVSGSSTSGRVTGLTNGTAYTFTVAATNAHGTGPVSAATGAATPRLSIFGPGTPSAIDGNDTGSVALGLKFRSDTDGYVTGIRFYKFAQNTGTHVGTLFGADGSVLAQATFTAETGSGWQAVKFTTPVPITANTTYVASYLAPNGHYAVTSSAFRWGGVDNPPLHSIANAASPNGLYAYTTTPSFPSQSYNASNYWVDVLFSGSQP